MTLRTLGWSSIAALAAGLALTATLARAQDPPPPAQAPAQAEAAAIVQGACTACHGLDFIGEHRKDRDGWDFTVRRMVDKGADLGVDDIPRVVDYLAKTFPKPDVAAPADKPVG